VAAGRRSARRQAVFALYRQDLLRLTPEAALRGSLDGETDPYAVELLRGTTGDLAAIDTLLQRHLADWSLERLGVLERSIMRVACYELLHEEGVPEAVIIDEAVGLAKRYCSAEAGALVNGVLGSMVADSSVVLRRRIEG
jgi:N utilization substance protein B